MNIKIQKLLTYIKKHSEKESAFLSSGQNWIMSAECLVDAIVRIFHLDKNEVCDLVDAIERMKPTSDRQLNDSVRCCS